MRTHPNDKRAVVEAFAKALDRDDFAAARALLAEDCQYDTGETLIGGADAVIEPYRTTSEKCRTTFDAIDYESRVSDFDGESFAVLYVDKLRKGPLRHEFRCSQLVFVDERGLIQRIEHREIEGERDKLKAFFDAANIEW